MITEMVIGKTLDEAKQISHRAVADALMACLPAKMHCSIWQPMLSAKP